MSRRAPGSDAEADPVLVWDNASRDQSAGLVEQLGASVIRAPENVGFAQAANELIQRTTTPYVLLLNPDVYLHPCYVEELEEAASADPTIGSGTGKLIRPARPGETPFSTRRATCSTETAWRRTEARTSPIAASTTGERDVFGVCAAAALYQRAMLDDVRAGRRVLRLDLLRLSRGRRSRLAGSAYAAGRPATYPRRSPSMNRGHRGDGTGRAPSRSDTR